MYLCDTHSNFYFLRDALKREEAGCVTYLLDGPSLVYRAYHPPTMPVLLAVAASRGHRSRQASRDRDKDRAAASRGRATPRSRECTTPRPPSALAMALMTDHGSAS